MRIPHNSQLYIFAGLPNTGPAPFCTLIYSLYIYILKDIIHVYIYIYCNPHDIRLTSASGISQSGIAFFFFPAGCCEDAGYSCYEKNQRPGYRFELVRVVCIFVRYCGPRILRARKIPKFGHLDMSLLKVEHFTMLQAFKQASEMHPFLLL